MHSFVAGVEVQFKQWVQGLIFKDAKHPRQKSRILQCFSIAPHEHYPVRVGDRKQVSGHEPRTPHFVQGFRQLAAFELLEDGRAEQLLGNSFVLGEIFG